MRQDDRAPFVRALERARVSAYGPGEFVEQESFMRASEILSLARRAGIAPGVSVLDLCCGVAGPGRFITRELECSYLGVDLSPSAIEIARARAGELACRFEVSQIPPIPAGAFEVVLLLETMLAFPDKERLLRQIADALPVGGRFAFTLEEGVPLTCSERERMPDADTVWLTPLEEMLACLQRVGFVVRWQGDVSRSHREMADSLIDAFTADATEIASQIGRRALDELVEGHRLWSDWLRDGRVRKIAFVAERAAPPRELQAVSAVSADVRTSSCRPALALRESSGCAETTDAATSTSLRPRRRASSRSILNAMSSSTACRSMRMPFARSVTARRPNAPWSA
jgi:sarcosine/dimethylglycine N-methyltransferase